MPEYLAPAVYVEEITTKSRPIDGVSTSTTGFAGETERGPTRLTLVTSWAEYERRYGSFVDRPPFNRAAPFLPYAVRGFFENGGRRLYLARVVGKSSVAASASLEGSGGATIIRATGEGDWGNNILVGVTAAAGGAGMFRISVAYFAGGVPEPFVEPTHPDLLEVFDDLSADATAGNFAPAIVNRRSELIEITACPAAPTFVSFPDARLSGGTYLPPSREDFAGAAAPHPEDRKGLAGLSAIPEIAIVAIPDSVAVDGLAADLLAACDGQRNRFAVVSEVRPHADAALIRPPHDTSYGGFYYPWLRVAAPHVTGGSRLVPATGHVAGIYARVDSQRGVHAAPANEAVNGIVSADQTGVVSPLSHILTQADQEVLNPRSVNAIRDFRAGGRGIRVWGARTMSSDALWKYVNVRRLMIFLERSIERGTRWVIFEPNVEATWAAVRGALMTFLTTVWRNGALQGRTQNEAFFVKCDRTTMTQDDIDNGRLVCEVGVAPVRPAEFIILRFCLVCSAS